MKDIDVVAVLRQIGSAVLQCCSVAVGKGKEVRGRGENEELRMKR
jgi:hypothetical protein